ncbi:hypothetical protein QJS10_CPA02g01252 [Acorus calamus]|uniref:Calcineurin-like phosphoesterase domain-containing protein n=1 Tax=Acorus calamus TaxID=4465 RepID=A0AAV9FCW0_ACOCL|nr:hypothetical protein QJS10_CPA02g01252 [Acorus calamus]
MVFGSLSQIGAGPTQPPPTTNTMLRFWSAVRLNPSMTSTSPSSSPLPSPHPSPPHNRSCQGSMALSVRIAVVGDVHDDWDLQEDSKALQLLQPDLVLFTGDYGNENVEVVRSIADLKMTKAAILGNHDCWHTHQFSEKKKDRVQLQLKCLGDEHVGYKRLDFPLLKLSVVGGRPFSCGGDRLFRPKLLSARYGVDNMEGSSKKICEAALETPHGHSIVLLAHNGPTGLGSKINDICGRDWVFSGGDHGDPDLARALSDIKASTQLSIPLVVFGHMHKELAYRKGQRKMIMVSPDSTVYLNGAIVPRVKYLDDGGGTSEPKSMKAKAPPQGGTLRAFTVVEFLNGRLEKITETWVSVVGEKAELELEHVLFKHG